MPSEAALRAASRIWREAHITDAEGDVRYYAPKAAAIIDEEFADAVKALKLGLDYFGGDDLETAMMTMVEDPSTQSHFEEVGRAALAKVRP